MSNGSNTSPKAQPDNGKSAGQSKPCRGRPRSEHSHEAILDAVLRLLEEEGYGALTIEGVARQAGVGKQTIYRWWKCRAELVLEAYANHTSSKIPVSDKGSLRADLEAFLIAGCKRLTDISGPIMRGLMADAVLDDEFREVLLDAFINKRKVAFKGLLARGVQRGELSGEADLNVVCDVVFGAIWHRLLLKQGRLDARFARQLAALVMSAHRPQVAPSPLPEPVTP
jgi:AcrR family transcriptional regulator